MRHLDLFAGIGGFSLAARWMGWKTVAQVEWDEWCQKVLAKNFPDALRFGDIVEFNKMLENGEITTDTNCCGYIHRKFTEQPTKGGVNAQRQSDEGDLHGRIDIGHIDIITGGFPCQPFSHAGKRKGTDDSRYLWPAMLETIRRVKPTYVVGENVAGLVSMENGKTLDRILSDLEDEGYTTEQVIIPACAVGAWHRRDRIWIICYNTNIADPLRKRYSVTTGGEDYKKKWAVCKEEQSNGDRIWPEINGHSNLIAHPVSQRGCSRNTGGEYAEDVRQQPGGEEHGYWDTEPSVGRVANGIPNRVDRLKGLGNAIVPQVAYQIFKAIEQYELKTN